MTNPECHPWGLDFRTDFVEFITSYPNTERQTNKYWERVKGEYPLQSLSLSSKRNPGTVVDINIKWFQKAAEVMNLLAIWHCITFYSHTHQMPPWIQHSYSSGYPSTYIYLHQDMHVICSYWCSGNGDTWEATEESVSAVRQGKGRLRLNKEYNIACLVTIILHLWPPNKTEFLQTISNFLST